MKIVTQHGIDDLIASGDKELIHSAYNALDVCVTREVDDVLEPRHDADTRRIYAFEHACQQPAIAMALRGVLIDPQRRAAAIKYHEEQEVENQRKVADLADAYWDAKEKRVGACIPEQALYPAVLLAGGSYRTHLWPRGMPDEEAACKRCGLSRLRPAPVNTNSPAQLRKLLYTNLGVRERRDPISGAVTTDAEALESIEREHRKLAQEARDRVYELASFAARRAEVVAFHERIADIAHYANAAKKERKQVGYAKSTVGPDGRMRSSFNVGAAETGRWSASQAPDWTGWNIQQISERLKGICIADPGLEFFYADLEQAESRIVAWDAGDEAYIQAHNTADVHTTVCKLMWPDLGWTGCDAEDRLLAERPTHFDPHHSFRDYGKRFQHGGNMGRTAAGVARQINCTVKQARDAYGRMYGDDDLGHAGAFPQIKPRHRAIHAEVQRLGMTISCLGRKRHFLGRKNDSETLREALGQLEQSPVADILNLALLRMWLELDTRLNIWDAPHSSQPNRIWLIAQVHDAVLGLRRPGDDDALRRVKELMTIPLLINGRVCTIPVEIMVGPSWSKTEMRKWHA